MGRPKSDKIEEAIEEQVDAALATEDTSMVPEAEEANALDAMTDEELAAAGFQADLVERQRNRTAE